ncbi:MobF family relaxase [Geomonas anaerohicana]|uniref:Relaxase domain-containing protein n=1 Tax=Geomonas anaerohicana TaxID=2798583 RepID=A0ABS0YC64_9BACT|nr:MobF family relaxase [Geomonas anaerohicana]MBJ6749919.1 relaxase domain-containing protein [Geomonas anaerohicana]
MLSLSNGGMTAGQAGKYFATEDYYLKWGESSLWLGKTARDLKLRGRVEEQAFRNVAAGKSPDGIEQLVAPKMVMKQGEKEEVHRAGNDLTFSAPKSLSVAYAAGNHEVKEIWDQAVINTMKYVEEHYSHYRTPDGTRIAGNIVAAKFDHVTSRALDPDVHSHVFLVNMVHTPEGKWLANEPKAIYQDKISIGMLAREEAIRLLREAGYQIYFTDREKFLFEIEGVRQEEMEIFSKRSAAIEEQVAEWQRDGTFPGVSETLLKQWAAFDTRDPKFKVTVQEIRELWDKFFREVSTTAQEVRARLEAAKAPAPPPPIHQLKSAREVLKEASFFLTDKEVTFERARVMKAAVQISGGQHSIAEFEGALNDRRQFHHLGAESHGWDAGKEYFTTRQMLKLEASNVDTLQDLGSFTSITSRPEVEAYLKGLTGAKAATLTPDETRFADAFAAGAASAAQTGLVDLSHGQKEHIVNELTGSNGFAITLGDPGTGKTFAAGVIERFNADVLNPTGREHHPLNLAYTGKAALEMETASGKEASTLHAFLDRYWTNPTPIPPQPRQQETQVVIRVDEASLVGGRQAEQLLKVVQDLKDQGHQVKLALIGDTKQLSSIQASPFFSHAAELARGGHGDLALLKEITRQKEAGLLEVATTLNRGNVSLGQNAADALKLLEQQGRVLEFPTRDELMRATVERYLTEADKPSLAADRAGEKQSVLVVTPLNADRQELNQKIRAARQEIGELGQGVTVDTFVPAEQGVTVAGYHPGMTVFFTGKRSQDQTRKESNQMPENGRGEVLSVDQLRNQVTVGFKDNRGGTSSRSFGPSELAQKATLYEVEQREFAPGDSVIFTKNIFDKSIVSAESGRKVKVRNGERGGIEKITSTNAGQLATVRLADGRRVNVNLDGYGPQFLEHGYAVTVHKGQGATVDVVLSYNYVQPTQNRDSSLKALTGIDTTPDDFKRWNAGLTAYDKRYRSEATIGGHTGTVFFVMIADRQNLQEQKGIAVRFSNGRAVMEDAATRHQMREAGMHWSPDQQAWVATVTNDRAFNLMTTHPLRDQRYLTQLKDDLAQAKRQPTNSAPIQPDHPRAGIDSTAETERYGRASYNLFNVALTRSRYDAAVFTNSVPVLKQAVQVIDMKTSTITKEMLEQRNTPQKSGAEVPRILPSAPIPTHQPIPPPQPVKAPDRELELKR